MANDNKGNCEECGQFRVLSWVHMRSKGVTKRICRNCALAEEDN